MAEGTLARPQQGVAKMPEVSGNTGQVGGNGAPLKGGLYRHPQTGAEIIAITDPITGDAQARAYVRVGFQWVRDVEASEIKEVGLDAPSEDFAKKAERSLEANAEELRVLRAQIAALQAAQSRQDEAKLRENTPTEESQQHAQDAAAQQVDARGVDNTGQKDSNGGVNASVTPSTDRKEATTSKKEGK